MIKKWIFRKTSNQAGELFHDLNKYEEAFNCDPKKVTRLKEMCLVIGWSLEADPKKRFRGIHSYIRGKQKRGPNREERRHKRFGIKRIKK